MEAQVKAAIEKYRRGDKESAFFELLEIPGDVLPDLIAAYNADPIVDIRAFLVKVSWQRRDRSALDFLGDALNAPEEDIWQQALDGFVTFASPESLRILSLARDRVFGNESDGKRFHRWLEEAIQQVELEIRRLADL